MDIEGGTTPLGLTLSGASSSRSSAARAQQAPTPVIGFLHGASSNSAAPQLDGFLRGLKDGGFVDGENLTIEYRWPRAAPMHCRRWPPIWYAVGLP